MKRPLTIKEALELKYLFCPKAVIDDGGRRERFMEAIRALYMNGYCICPKRRNK